MGVLICYKPLRGIIMNKENLHEIISRYETHYAEINNKENNEIFKWKAVKCFQQEWFSPNNDGLPFSILLAKAKRETSVLIDNSTVSPANGIEKMAEYFAFLGMPASLREFDIPKESITRLTELCTFGRSRTVKSYTELDFDKIKDIYESCY